MRPALARRSERVSNAPTSYQLAQTLHVWLPSDRASGAKTEFPNSFLAKPPAYLHSPCSTNAPQ